MLPSSLLILSLALAAEPAPVQSSCPPPAAASLALEGHGPEKPPPSDGYEFKSKKGGNFLAKLGLFALVAGTATLLSSFGQEKGSEVRAVRAQSGAGLIGTGVLLIAIERAR